MRRFSLTERPTRRNPVFNPIYILRAAYRQRFPSKAYRERFLEPSQEYLDWLDRYEEGAERWNRRFEE